MAPDMSVILNDPYQGGTHLPDVTLIKPLFTGGTEAPSFFASNRAHHADGTDRAVTGLTVFTSTNTASAVVSADGVVNGQRRGESFVMAMFYLVNHPVEELKR